MASEDKIITQKHSRLWLQDGSARPGNPARLAGVNGDFVALDSLSTPVSGGITRIRVHDPRIPGRYITVGTTIDPADFPSGSLMIRQKHGGLSRLLGDDPCDFDLYVLTGKCRDLSDFQAGWSDKVTIIAGCEKTNADRGSLVSFETDDVVEPTVDFTATGGVYDAGSLSFGEGGSTIVTQEMIDVCYGDTFTCGDCGPANNGAQWIYALSTTGVAAAGVVYSTDAGRTWTALAITGMGAAEVPTAIRKIGQNLVVFSKLGGGATLSSHYISPINPKTGVPSSTWTEVSTGYVATFTLNDVLVIGTTVYIAASGGYIYTSTDIAAGVTVLSAANATTVNLTRIHGTYDGTIVAVGASGTVLKSTNAGVTFAVTTTLPVVATLSAVHVLDQDRYWVGAVTDVYATLNGGETWALRSFPGSGAGQVTDIRFATNNVGYITHTTAAPVGRVIATLDGGDTWNATVSRIVNMPTNLRLNRLAIPDASLLMTRANNVAVAGLSAGTDGLILLAATNMN